MKKALLLCTLLVATILFSAVHWRWALLAAFGVASQTSHGHPTNPASVTTDPVFTAAGPVVWVVGNLDRIGPNDSPGNVKQAVLKGARREYVDFQVVVRAALEDLTNVNVTATDLAGPGGAILSKSNYSLYREHYVTFNTGSPDDGPWASNRPQPPGTYPDPLIPFNDPSTGTPLSGNGAMLQAVPFNMSAERNQPFWCDLFIPPGTPPGVYTGTIHVISDQGSAEVEVSLTVWNFELPQVPSEKTLFIIFDNARAADVANQKALLRHKIMPRQIFNPSLAGSYTTEFGLNRTALLYYGDSTCNSMNPPPSVPEIHSQAADYPAQLPLDIFVADEISGCDAIYPIVKEWARNAHAAGLEIVITMQPDVALYDDGSGTGKPAVDYWAMLPKQWPRDLSGIPGKLWSYNACEQDNYSPKWQIDFAPINFRIQAGFLNQTQGATGLLYWAVDYWPNADMWTNVLVPACGHHWPGEGFLIYPAEKIGSSEPAPSMRLKYLRDGIQDYEYDEMLKSFGQGSWALAQVSTVAPDWANWSQDPASLANVRDTLGQKLHELGSRPNRSVILDRARLHARVHH